MRLYNSLNDFLRRRFGVRVQKVSVHMGFSCPNRDGTKGFGGCIYCNDRSLYPSDISGSLRSQIERGIERMKRRYGAEKFIVYFQSNTNTYAEIDKLEKLYNEAIAFPSVVGLAIGTRPDCVSDDLLDLLQDISHRTYLWMEYGLQSASDETLMRINRCHTVHDFADAVDRTHRKGIEVCAHVIIGLPGETWNEYMNTADFLAKLLIDGVKIHAFHVIKDTVAEKWYNNKKLEVLTMESYVSHVADFLERLPESVVIHRSTGEVPKEYLVAPDWVKNKMEVIERIKEKLRERGTYQGIHCRRRSIFV